MGNRDRIDSKYAPSIEVAASAGSAFERIARAHALSRGAEGTRKLYLTDIARWLAFCAKHGIDPGEPSMEAATMYRDHLSGALGPQSVRRELSALSRMYRAAVNARPQGATWNPFDSDALARPPESNIAKTQTITEEETERVIAAAMANEAHGLCDVALLRLLHATGMRISSALTLQRSKLFERNGVLVARIRAKKKDEVEVEIPETATRPLRVWLEAAPASKYVFPSRDGKGHMLRRVFARRLETYGEVAGVERVHPHRFRAAFITDALDAGVPLHEVQAAVHHTDPSVTLRYDRGVRGTGVTSAVAAFRKKTPQ